ncbi:MAG: amino acid ABC transporter permease, partial [Oscillibacter sp.]|nr:amino acid ABC transporter permease [Oscillibacter sp.]
MFLTVTASLVKGLGTAMELFGLTLLFSLPLGLVIAFGSMSKWQPFKFLLYGQEAPGRYTRFWASLRPISALTNIVVWVIRGTPLLLQLTIIFYGPGLWFDNNIWAFGSGRMTSCVVAFVINYSCYFSVIYRGGIEGVPQGQRE